MSKRYSITFLASVFVGVVCMSLVVVDVWRSFSARDVEVHEMERLSSNLARAMAQQADDTIKAADTVLADIVERLETDGRSPPQLARLHRQMVAQVVNLPQLAGLFVYDADGSWLANSQPVLALTHNNADRGYFIFHRDHPARGAHLGAPVISRSSGRWVLPLSRRLNHPDGSFAGVVLATLDLDYFRRFYQSFDIGDLGAVALVSNEGVMMVRRPFTDDFIGRDVSKTELLRHFSALSGAARTGTVWITSPTDGEVRLNSFRPLEHYPLFVTAALSKQEMLADWRRDSLLRLSGVLLLATLLFYFGRRLVGQIRLRELAEAELRRTRDALEHANRTLERQAMQDGLTGLANRRQLDVTLGNEFSRAIRHADSLAFIMIDVDYFKQYNDVYGHSGGDACLRTVSKLIRGLTPRRPGDLTARYGGEEIAILMPNTDAAGARAVAERIRAAIEAERQTHSGSPLGVITISAGVAAMRPQRGDLAQALVDAADKALYQAKLAGRNRVGVAAPASAPLKAR